MVNDCHLANGECLSYIMDGNLSSNDSPQSARPRSCKPATKMTCWASVHSAMLPLWSMSLQESLWTSCTSWPISPRGTRDTGSHCMRPIQCFPVLCSPTQCAVLCSPMRSYADSQGILKGSQILGAWVVTYCRRCAGAP